MKGVKAAVYCKDEYSHIPTRGLPCSVLDAYRSAAFFKDPNDQFNDGVIFYENYNDIAVFEDEIESFDDILRFETALRFILLKDHISVLEPSVRYSVYTGANSFDSYYRLPEYSKDSANEVYRGVGANNFLLPIEKIFIKDKKVIKSTNEHSIYLDSSQDEISSKIATDSVSNDFLHTLPQSLSIPFIYGNSTDTEDHQVIVKDFFESLDSNFAKETEYTVKLGYGIQLPFFTNAVLSIAKNRDNIHDAVLELRAELSLLRKQLFKYEKDFRGISNQRELSLLQQDVKESILALTKKIYEPNTLISDTINLIISFVTNPNEYYGKVFNPRYSLKNDFPVLFGNANYKRLRNLLKNDNISTNIEYFLTDEEMKRVKATQH